MKIVMALSLAVVPVAAMNNNALRRAEESTTRPAIKMLIIPVRADSPPTTGVRGSEASSNRRQLMRTDSVSPTVSSPTSALSSVISEHISMRAESPRRVTQLAQEAAAAASSSSPDLKKDINPSYSPRRIVMVRKINGGSPRSEAAFLKVFGDEVLSVDKKREEKPRLTRVSSVPAFLQTPKEKQSSPRQLRIREEEKKIAEQVQKRRSQTGITLTREIQQVRDSVFDTLDDWGAVRTQEKQQKIEERQQKLLAIIERKKQGQQISSGEKAAVWDIPASSSPASDKQKLERSYTVG